MVSDLGLHFLPTTLYGFLNKNGLKSPKNEVSFADTKDLKETAHNEPPRCSLPHSL